MSNFRRRLMCVQQHGGLPAGYQEVEYIESTGTQWIDLNLYATDVGSWELEGAFTKIPPATKFEGNGSFGNANNRFDIGVFNKNFWIAIGTQNNTIPADYNKHYFKLDRINGRAYLDSRILSFPPVDWLTQAKKMRLFGRTYYVGGDDNQFCASMKCYSNKMYDDNNNLIMNLIPCLDTHSVPCMYDTVSKQTFYNQGTGEFLYPIEKKYTPVEYLESTGTQYIDLGIRGNQDSRIDLKIQPTSVQAKAAIFGHFGGNYSSYYLYSSGSGLFQVGYKYFGDSNVAVETIIYNISNEKNIFNINEYEYSLPSITGNFETGSNLFLFNISGGNYTGLPMKLYSFKLYNNTDLIRDCIPVIDSSGRPCLYDKVEDKFYYNAGTGEFLYPIDEKYTPVEYIESTGTQYINTEVKTKQSLKIECIFSGNQVSTLLFGARKTASLDGLAWGFNNTAYAFSGFGGSTQQNNTTVNTVDGEKHTVVLSNEVYTIDDVNQSLPNRGTFSDFYDIYLFTWNNANVVDTRKFKGKVYNFKIYDNNVLIRDMIPVLDKNNIACMYDKVNKEFYYNQGTGEFLYE